VLGGKWKLILMYWLGHGVHRFSDLHYGQAALPLVEQVRSWGSAHLRRRA